MTKIIEFTHCGETIRSVAIFNFEPSQCSVMVMPYLHKDELGNSIVITRKNRNWESEAPVALKHKLTYLNILNELDLLVIQYENFKKVFPGMVN
jgi:hypothetical protein